jgi:acyl-CoA synthetase (AMP-forming)/AMP-acid ligase II
MTTVIPDMDPARPARSTRRRSSSRSALGDHDVRRRFSTPPFGRAPVGTAMPRVLSAGAPVSPQIIERFASLLPVDARILTPYGASEALPVTAIESREILAETRHGSDHGAGVCVGPPVPSISQVIRPGRGDAGLSQPARAVGNAGESSPGP